MGLISVLIPNYNQARFLSTAIQSVLDQSFTDFELVIVDDCSSDESLEVIAKFRDPRIRVVENEENLGRAKNINKCFSLAHGSYLTLLPADCWLTAESLKLRLDPLERQPSVCFSFCQVDSSGTAPPAPPCSIESWDRIYSGEKFFRELVTGTFVYTASVIFRRTHLNEVGYLREEVAPSHRDWDLFLRLSLRHDVAFVALPLVHDRKHSSNCSNYYARTGVDRLCEYLIIVDTFSTVGSQNPSLAQEKTAALDALGLRCLRSATAFIRSNDKEMARRVLWWSISFRMRSLLNPKLYVFFLLSLWPSMLGLLDRLRATATLLRNFCLAFRR